MTKKLLMIVVPVMAAVGAGTAIASAVPNDSAVIRVCVTKAGTFRSADGGECKKGETPLAWNQQGPAGAAGPAGPQGPAGVSEANLVGGDPLQGGQADGLARVDGVAGEGEDGQIEVKSFAFGGKNSAESGSGGGGGAGKVSFNNVRFAKLYDASSPKLLLRMASGEHTKSVTFTFRKPGTSQTFLTYMLSDVTVADYEQGGDKERPLLEHVELTFAKVEVSYVPAGGGAPVTAGWDVKANKSV
jgi:type VI secretion system secreted protein Hcp